MTDEEIAREATFATCEQGKGYCMCRADEGHPWGTACLRLYECALAAIALLRERERQGGDRLSHDGERG